MVGQSRDKNINQCGAAYLLQVYLQCLIVHR